MLDKYLKISLVPFLLLLSLEGFAKAKYVFLLIGDGMGLTHVSMSEIYLSSLTPKKKLHLRKLKTVGIMTTDAQGNWVTDSAAAGTTIATGKKTKFGVIGMNAKTTKKLTSIAEKAKDKGMKVGIISTTSINHATPASFYSHRKSRRMYDEIAIDLANSGFDYFGGGGIRAAGDVMRPLKKKGYRTVNTREDFLKLSSKGRDKDQKVVAICPKLNPNDLSCPYSIDQKEGGISLAEFTRKGIELLDNDKGFFMMIEGGMIDPAAHANDAATAIKDILAFDQAVKVALDFQKKHPRETVIVVTADHETGGLGLGSTSRGHGLSLERLRHQKVSHQRFGEIIAKLKRKNSNPSFKKILALIKENFGLGQKGLGLELTQDEINELKKAFRQSITKGTIAPPRRLEQRQNPAYLAYGHFDPIVTTTLRLLNRKAGIGWTTFHHTAVPVPVFATGVGGEKFGGYYDNTKIHPTLTEIMGL